MSKLSSPHKTITAIILIALLSIGIAVILYVTFFDHLDDHSHQTSKEAKHIATDGFDQPTVTFNKSTPSPLIMSDDNNEIHNDKKTNELKNNNDSSLLTPKSDLKTSPTPPQDAIINNDNPYISNKTNIVNEAKNKSAKAATIEPSKSTKTYEQLDDDIEQDSEQLAELIGEIKDRNQRQIEQRQSEMTNAQIPPNSVPQADPPPQDPVSE